MTGRSSAQKEEWRVCIRRLGESLFFDGGEVRLMVVSPTHLAPFDSNVSNLLQ